MKDKRDVDDPQDKPNPIKPSKPVTQDEPAPSNPGGGVPEGPGDKPGGG